MAKTEIEEQISLLARGVVDLIDKKELEDRLAAGRPLRVKVGFDPTSPDLHLGHTVIFTKMRQFQDLGHTVIFLIGDFTATIGDPSGQNSTRPMVDQKTIGKNAEFFTKQAFKVLDKEKTEVRHNSEWMGSMGASDLIRLAQEHTVARMLERRDFAKRFKEKRPIAVHEFLYPIVQGYDSVMLKCDVELGGTDQLFNLTVGRTLQSRAGQLPQIVITLPLLTGISGEEKMSKSAGNYIGVDEPAEEIYAKLMSIDDEKMWHYYELLSLVGDKELAARKKAAKKNGPSLMEAKDALALEITSRFASKPDAKAAQEAFRVRFREHGVPEDIPEFTITVPQDGLVLSALLKQAGLVPSVSQCRRLFTQGGIKVNGKRVDEERRVLAGESILVQVGKRISAKISASKG